MDGLHLANSVFRIWWLGDDVFFYLHASFPIFVGKDEAIINFIFIF